MFSGGDVADVGRWLRNFVASHAKGESARVEGVVDAAGPRKGESYRVRLRLGERYAPPLAADPVELPFAEVRDNRGSLDWCQALGGRIRALARELLDAGGGARRSA